MAAGNRPQSPLRQFEKQLLESVGFGLQLEFEASSGQPIRADAHYEYLPESGPRQRESDNGENDELVSGAALLALESGAIGDEHLRELKMLMRKLIRYHLGDRKLKSQSLFLQN